MRDIITCLLHVIYWQVKYTDEDISNMKYSSKVVDVSKHLLFEYKGKEVDTLLPILIYMHKNNYMYKHSNANIETFTEWVYNIIYIFDSLNGETKEYYELKAEGFLLENL
jgi:hypothetical protein